MKVGDLVWNNYHGVLRFGTVKSKRIDESGWAYYKVNWHSDDVYERAMNIRKKLTHTDHRMKEYRKDQIKLASRNNLSKVLRQHDNIVNSIITTKNMGLCAPSCRLDVV